MINSTLNSFLIELSQLSIVNAFNPWRDFAGPDSSPDAPVVRLQNFRNFLSERIKTCRVLLVAEALGYKGGRFSGIPLTSEQIVDQWSGESNLFKASPAFATTSARALTGRPYSEATATIVWTTIDRLKLSKEDVVTWNIFPLHPYKPAVGLLSNRTPTQSELALGVSWMSKLVALLPKKTKLITVGRKSSEALASAGFDVFGSVRHPSNGGGKMFSLQLAQALADLRVRV